MEILNGMVTPSAGGTGWVFNINVKLNDNTIVELPIRGVFPTAFKAKEQMRFWVKKLQTVEE